MELGKFLKYLIDRRVCILNDHLLDSYSVGGVTKVPASFFRALAELTKDIDYGCGFDAEGVCQRNRDRNYLQGIDTSPLRRKQCCCGQCSSSVGYLGQITFDLVDKYAELFDEKTGFWREGVGCVLSRQLRSATCLRHYCVTYDTQTLKTKRLPPRSEAIITLLRDVAMAYLDYNNWYGASRDRKWICFSLGSLSEYVDAWLIRCPEGLMNLSYCSNSKAKTWRDYYEKNSDTSKSNAASHGR